MQLEDLISREIGKIECDEDTARDKITQFRVIKGAVNNSVRIIEKDTTPEPYTLGTWLDKWYKLYKEPINKPATLKKQLNLIRNIKLLPLSQLVLSDITPIVLQNFLLSVDKVRQREHYYTLLKDSLSKAYIAKVIDYDISKAIILKAHKSAETPIFTEDEEQRFIKACENNNLSDYFLVMLNSGLRPSEAYALKVCDIDLQSGVIHVTRSCRTANSTKSPCGTRSIPIFDKITPILTRKIDGKQKDEYVFNHANSALYREFGAICQSADLVGFIPYSLRHTFATRCAERGIAPKVLQKWLGHSDIRITLKFYIHVRDAFEKINIDIFNS